MIGNSFATDWLKLVLQAVAIANLADNAASSPLATLYVALHTADPGIGGSQQTNEAAYTNYARIAVARSAAGWAVAAGVGTPVSRIDGTVCTASPGSALTHWSIGIAQSGAGKILFSGPLSPNVTMAVGIQPQIANDSTVTLA